MPVLYARMILLLQPVCYKRNHFDMTVWFNASRTNVRRAFLKWTRRYDIQVSTCPFFGRPIAGITEANFLYFSHLYFIKIRNIFT